MSSAETPPLPSRLLSLDFLRGAIMVLLAMASTGIYDYLEEQTRGEPFHGFIRQLTHHPWHGLFFWDLVQPAFMFMAGVAMALSLHKQWANGMTWAASFRKILKRCAWLFFFGVLDYAVRPQGLSFELWDVLTQLAFTTLVAFLIFRWSFGAQVGVCAGLLLLTEALYRGTNLPGFDQPFVDQHNFGNYMDLVLMNKINHDGWVAINCLPTAVHTIAGALAGKSITDGRLNLRAVLGWGLACLVVGYGLDGAGVTPIIKRIATSSFTIVSLGWCLWFLAASYWVIDVKGCRRHLKFFTIVGMNSLFIYVFFEIVGERWFNGYVTAISTGLVKWLHPSAIANAIIAAGCIFTLEWLLCYFLYRKRIFFRV